MTNFIRSVARGILGIFPFLRPLAFKINYRNVKNNFFSFKNVLVRDFFSLNAYNLNSLDMSNGLTLGFFKNKKYLFNVRAGDTVESRVLFHGAWEKNILDLMSHFLEEKANSNVIDVGANVGAISVPMAINYPKTNFYCFEPHPLVFQRLTSNKQHNALNNLNPVNSAVSVGPAQIDFYMQDSMINMGLSSIKQNADIAGKSKCVKVANTTLDNYFASNSLPVSIIKVDTQGTELSVLKSATKIIQKDRPVIFFEFEDTYCESEQDRLQSVSDIKKFFTEHNYKLFAIQHSELRYYPLLTLDGKYNGDILALPN